MGHQTRQLEGRFAIRWGSLVASLCVVISLFLASLPASAQENVSFIDFPFPREPVPTSVPFHDCMLVFRFGDDPGLTPPRGSSEARDINEFGQVAGWVMDTDRMVQAVRWESDGSVTYLGSLGGRQSCALGINFKGDVVGWAQTSTGEAHAFLWSNGFMTDLGADRADFTVAFAINDAGDIAGMAWPVIPALGSPMGRAIEWTTTGMIDLGTCLGTPCSAALDINNVGMVVGWTVGEGLYQHAFLWDGTKRTDLGALSARASQARAINEAGAIVGWFEVTEGLRHAGLWANGTLTDLGLPGSRSVANDIAQSGEIVGAAAQGGGNLEPLLWAKDGLVALGTLGGFHGEAYAINRFSEVVGWSQTATGVPHAFLWKDSVMVDLTPTEAVP